MRLVLDANIYIAAYLDKGLSADILRFGQRGKIDIFTTSEIVSETTEKLRKKFKSDDSDIKTFIDLVNKSTHVVVPKKKIEVVKADPDDDKILECALSAEADIIITMNKHLLRLKKFENAAIIHPKTLTWILPKLFKF